MASSEPLSPPPAYFLRPPGHYLRPEGPQFKLRVFSSVPSAVPRRIGRCMTVPTPPAWPSPSSDCLGIRSVQLIGSRVGSVTRLHVRLCYGPDDCSPFTDKGLLHSSFHLRVTPEGVEYDYAGIQSIPATGLTPARHAAVWAANEGHGEEIGFNSPCYYPAKSSKLAKNNDRVGRLRVETSTAALSTSTAALSTRNRPTGALWEWSIHRVGNRSRGSRAAQDGLLPNRNCLLESPDHGVVEPRGTPFRSPSHSVRRARRSYSYSAPRYS